jgi:hypothetical protein
VRHIPRAVEDIPLMHLGLPRQPLANAGRRPPDIVGLDLRAHADHPTKHGSGVRCADSPTLHRLATTIAIMLDDIHRLRDAERLALHEFIADHLRAEPEKVLAIARANLERWLGSDPDSQPYYREWQEIIESRPLTDILALITSETEEGRRLRQSTPFTGVVTQQERERAFAAARERLAGSDA